MPALDKKKLMTFAKKTAAPSPAAGMLAQKRAMAAAPPSPAHEAAEPPAVEAAEHAGGAIGEGDEEQMHIFDLVDEAEEHALAGDDAELEDVIAGSDSTGPDDVPMWAEDAEKWAEAAEAVGLGMGAEDQFDEPFVVTAYLYRMIGGPVTGLELPPPEIEPEAEEADMTKPGAAAKALNARAQSKAAPVES